MYVESTEVIIFPLYFVISWRLVWSRTLPSRSTLLMKFWVNRLWNKQLWSCSMQQIHLIGTLSLTS